jgi:hypothetical protein
MSSSSRCAALDRRGRRALLVAAGAAWLLPRSVRANEAPPSEVAAALPGATLQGQGRLRYFGLHVYDAVLWSQRRLAANEVLDAEVALELRYARTLRGPLIAERSIEEMKRVGEFNAEQSQRWLAAMTRLFPDVNDGDRITGVHRPGRGAAFFVNGRAVGDVADAAFARLFFGVWLSPRTSEPALRSALLGGPT